MTTLHTPPPVDTLLEPGRPPARPHRKGFRLLTATIGGVVLGLLLGLIGAIALDNGPATEATVSATTTAATLPATTASATVATATGLTDVSDIAGSVVDSVVTVEVTGQFRGQNVVVGSGSGVILDSTGTIVTNAHVVDAGSGINVVLTDGTEYPATVVGVDDSNDLAVISIDATGLDPIELGTTDGLEVGDPVIAVGNPLGLEGGPSVSTGIVSALDRSLQESDVSLEGIIQTDAAITEGSSGGALLDGQGRLIGITTAVGVSSVGIEGIGFAIPVETINQVVANLTGV